ncbi:MAG: hypothetical protein WB783_12585 [Arenicellales bacterium]
MKRAIAILIAIAILVGVYFYQRHRHEESISLSAAASGVTLVVEATTQRSLVEATERTMSKAAECTASA